MRVFNPTVRDRVAACSTLHNSPLKGPFLGIFSPVASLRLSHNVEFLVQKQIRAKMPSPLLSSFASSSKYQETFYSLKNSIYLFYRVITFLYTVLIP